MSEKGKIIWITWEYQIRNKSICQLLDVELAEIVIAGNRAVRYLKSAIKTFKLIKIKAPDTIIHQNPSIVLCYLLLVLRPFLKFKLVSDTHNSGITPLEGRSILLNTVARYYLSKCDLVVCHNDEVAKLVPKFKDLVILPDPLPTLNPMVMTNKEKSVVYVTSWGADEPYHEFLEAALQLQNENTDLTIKVTGRPPAAIVDCKRYTNIQFLGFVDRQTYDNTLGLAMVVVVLTKRSDSLNCGAYEALSLAKPCVLSDSEVLRNFFGDSFIYTKNSEGSIKQSILMAVGSANELALEMSELKTSYQSAYRRIIQNFSYSLESL